MDTRHVWVCKGRPEHNAEDRYDVVQNRVDFLHRKVGSAVWAMQTEVLETSLSGPCPGFIYDGLVARFESSKLVGGPQEGKVLGNNEDDKA